VSDDFQNRFGVSHLASLDVLATRPPGGIGRRVAPLSPPQIRACEFPGTRLPAPPTFTPSCHLDCSLSGPFTSIRTHLTYPDNSASLVSFGLREPPPRQHPFGLGIALSARLPVALRLAAFASWGILCPLGRQFASRRPYWQCQTPSGLLRSTRPRCDRGGSRLCSGARCPQGPGRHPAPLIAHHCRNSHFRQPAITERKTTQTRPAFSSPPPALCGWQVGSAFPSSSETPRLPRTPLRVEMGLEHWPRGNLLTRIL
jgi:hypothetical protein